MSIDLNDPRDRATVGFMLGAFAGAFLGSHAGVKNSETMFNMMAAGAVAGASIATDGKPPPSTEILENVFRIAASNGVVGPAPLGRHLVSPMEKDEAKHGGKN